MTDANSFLSADERREAEKAIAAAEERTAAEIVCAVATESGRYDRSEALVGLFTGLAMLLLFNLAAAVVGTRLAQPGDWDPPNLSLSFAAQAVAVLFGFLLGNLLASYWHGLRRCFVRRAQLEAETQRAAAFVFAARRISSTRQAGGLLLYVSLFERRVVVLADDGVMNKLGQSFLNQLRETAVEHLKAKQPLATLTDTVAQAGDQLAQALPRESDDADELPNALILLHPRP